MTNEMITHCFHCKKENPSDRNIESNQEFPWSTDNQNTPKCIVIDHSSMGLNRFIFLISVQ